jgi:pimeloyl-ACP methyl ester carboxylesterase
MLYNGRMSVSLIGPTSHTYYSQRLRLHYVDWGNESAPPLLLVHGNRDHCRNWDWIAEAMRSDYHIIAPDLRGHGDSQWVLGGTYPLIDYVYDIAQLIHQKKLAPLTIIGHSLGGHIAMQYAGIYPASVRKLVSIEGFGPPLRWIRSREKKAAAERMTEWIAQLRDLAGRAPRKYVSIDEAVARMREANAFLSEAQARHLTMQGVNQNEDGTFSWKFDNYVRAGSPYLFNEAELAELWGNIACPTLLIRGTESWAGDPSKDGRAAYLKSAEVVAVEKAGHWVHHDQLPQVLDAIRGFLAR